MSRIEKFLTLLVGVCGLLSLFVYPLNSAGEGIAASPKLQIFCGLILIVVAVFYALEESVLQHRLLSGIVVCAV